MESLPQKMAGVVLKMEHDGSSNVFARCFEARPRVLATHGSMT